MNILGRYCIMLIRCIVLGKVALVIKDVYLHKPIFLLWLAGWLAMRLYIYVFVRDLYMIISFWIDVLVLFSFHFQWTREFIQCTRVFNHVELFSQS